MAREAIGFAACTRTSICFPGFVGSCSFLVISSSLRLVASLLCGCLIICLDFCGSAVTLVLESCIALVAFVDTGRLVSLAVGFAVRIIRVVEG